MFTGLVQSAGEILSLDRRGRECRITVRPGFSLADVVDGESIAVNGACLSVERHDDHVFVAYASAETMSRTNLGSLSQGSTVNLERALRVGDRLGGHIVSGHVDCQAVVRSVRDSGQSLVFTLAYPREFAGQVIAKGSVCLDGISLTVNGCSDEGDAPTFTVNVIPDTRKRTTVRLWTPGHSVNMETDVLGKYVERALSLGVDANRHPLDGAKDSPSGSPKDGTSTGGTITREFLLENGFL